MLQYIIWLWFIQEWKFNSLTRPSTHLGWHQVVYILSRHCTTRSRTLPALRKSQEQKVRFFMLRKVRKHPQRQFSDFECSETFRSCNYFWNQKGCLEQKSHFLRRQRSLENFGNFWSAGRVFHDLGQPCIYCTVFWVYGGVRCFQSNLILRPYIIPPCTEISIVQL